MIKRSIGLFAWVYKRLQLSSGLFSFFLLLSNFAASIILLFNFDAEGAFKFFLLITVFFGLLVFLSVVSFVVFDILRFNTRLQEKDIELNDYMLHRLSPIQMKMQLLQIKADRAVIEKDLVELKRLEELVESCDLSKI